MTESPVEPLVRSDRHDVQGVAVVCAAGEIDMMGAPVLEWSVAAELAASPRALVLDVSAVSFLAAAGVGVISRAARIADERGVALRLVARGGIVLRILELTGVDRLVPIGTSRDIVLAMLRERDHTASPTARVPAPDMGEHRRRGRQGVWTGRRRIVRSDERPPGPSTQQARAAGRPDVRGNRSRRPTNVGPTARGWSARWLLRLPAAIPDIAR